MANELVINYPTGSTLYAMLFDATGQVYNGSTFEAPASANWTTYDIAMTEVATATGIYRASMPAVAAGAYGWTVRKQAGASPAVSDITVGTGSIRWTGTAEEAVPAAVNVTMQAGVLIPGPLALEATSQAILEDTGTTLPGLFAASGATVTVISTVDGGTITVYVADTWSFTVTDSTLDLSGYEVVALSVKRSARQADAEALLYLRSDTGLQRIGGATPASAGNGTLSKTSTSFTALVALAETGGLAAGRYTWWLKGFDTTPAPDTGYTLATGEFVLERAGLAAVA